MPRGITVLEAGDEIIALVDDDAAHELGALVRKTDRLRLAYRGWHIAYRISPIAYRALPLP